MGVLNCPICRERLQRRVIGSTKFERESAVLVCSRCRFEVPEAETVRVRSEPVVRPAPRETARRLAILTAATRVSCPVCRHRLRYHVRQQYLECSECNYQEYLARDHVVSQDVLA